MICVFFEGQGLCGIRAVQQRAGEEERISYLPDARELFFIHVLFGKRLTGVGRREKTGALSGPAF